MFDSKRKYKKILTAGILAVLVVVGIARLNIQSVDEYQKEQKQLAEELLVSEIPKETGIPEQSQVPPAGEVVSAGPSVLPSVSPSGKKKKKAAKELPSPSAKRNDTTAEQNNKKVASDKKKQKTEKRKRSEKKSGTQENKSNTAKPSAVPSSKNPLPSRIPETGEDESEVINCRVAIRCESLLDHMSEVDPSIKKYIPSDGKLLPVTTLKAKQGDTAYTILQKVCKAKNIALDAEYSSTFSTEYVRGIGHLYEKQAGDMSGWLYLVNGKLLNRGASSYQLKEGDLVEWVYTCTGRLE